MQPSAVKPAPTTCRRRLDVACVVGLSSRLRLSMACSIILTAHVFDSGSWMSKGGKPTTRKNASRRQAGLDRASNATHARSSPRLQLVGDGSTSLAWWGYRPGYDCRWLARSCWPPTSSTREAGCRRMGSQRLEKMPHAGRPGSTVRRMQPSAVKPAPATCRRRLDVACVVVLPSRLRLSMACSIVLARASPGARRTARASADARRCGRKRIRLTPCDEKRESTF